MGPIWPCLARRFPTASSLAFRSFADNSSAREYSSSAWFRFSSWGWIYPRYDAHSNRPGLRQRSFGQVQAAMIIMSANRLLNLWPRICVGRSSEREIQKNCQNRNVNHDQRDWSSPTPALCPISSSQKCADSNTRTSPPSYGRSRTPSTILAMNCDPTPSSSSLPSGPITLKPVWEVLKLPNDRVT